MSGDTYPKLPIVIPDTIASLELLEAPVLGRFEEVPPGESFTLYVESSKPPVPGQKLPSDYYVFSRVASNEDNWFEWTVNARDVSDIPVTLIGAATDDPAIINNGVIQQGMRFMFVKIGRRAPDGLGPDGAPYWSSPMIVGEKAYNLNRVVAVRWPWGLRGDGVVES